MGRFHRIDMRSAGISGIASISIFLFLLDDGSRLRLGRMGKRSRFRFALGMSGMHGIVTDGSGMLLRFGLRKFERLCGIRLRRKRRNRLGRIGVLMGVGSDGRDGTAQSNEEQGYHAHYVAIIRQRAAGGPHAKARAKKNPADAGFVGAAKDPA